MVIILYIFKDIVSERNPASKVTAAILHNIFLYTFLLIEKFAPRPYYINYFQMNKRLHFLLL